MRRLPGWRSRVALGLLLAGGALAWAQEPEDSTAPRPQVIHARLDSIIHPVAEQFVGEVLDEAALTGADALILELSTPGGLSESMQKILPRVVSSDVPVVVYVSPSGARAASAGFFILMAADVAAMAPATNTGAAASITAQGEDIEGTLGEKIEQDSLATIRSLATRYGRNVEMAEAAVKESRSYTAQEALDGGLIDLIADDLPALLAALDGRELADAGEGDTPLRTADAQVREIEMSAFQRFLSTIAHPNIAYILMTLGGLGLYFELSNPGAILPGVIGGICLILAFFALSVLPVNYAGIALIVLAMIFFIAEVKVVSYGMLTVAGLISLVLGSLMLFRSPDPAIRVSLDVILSVTIFAVVVVAFLMVMVVRAHRSQVRTGVEGLVNREGVARTDLSPKGKVFVHGEIWDAVAESRVESGEPVTVVAVDGMKLRVRGVGGPDGGP